MKLYFALLCESLAYSAVQSSFFTARVAEETQSPQRKTTNSTPILSMWKCQERRTQACRFSRGIFPLGRHGLCRNNNAGIGNGIQCDFMNILGNTQKHRNQFGVKMRSAAVGNDF